jgi:hypothetical protein
MRTIFAEARSSTDHEASVVTKTSFTSRRCAAALSALSVRAS